MPSTGQQRTQGAPRAALLLLLLAVAPAGCSTEGGVEGPRTQVSERTDISNHVTSETVKVGNTKTKNYHIEAAEFRPTQLTQVVLNVPKLPKYLRKTRPPSDEELLVKRRLLEVFEEVRRGTPSYLAAPLNHLHRILDALNPKYISTERVVRAVFGDQLPASFFPAPNDYASGQQQQAHREPPVSAASLPVPPYLADSYASASASASLEYAPTTGYGPPDMDAAEEREFEVQALAGSYFQPPAAATREPLYGAAHAHQSHGMRRFLPKLAAGNRYKASQQQQQYLPTSQQQQYLPTSQQQQYSAARY